MKHTPLEIFVQSYIRSHNRKSLSKKSIQRAIYLINRKLNNPCCTDEDAVVTETFYINDNFTNTVQQFLNLITIKNNKESLNRTVDLLEKAIGIPCCD